MKMGNLFRHLFCKVINLFYQSDLKHFLQRFVPSTQLQRSCLIVKFESKENDFIFFFLHSQLL